MEPVIIYFLKVNVGIIILFAAYFLLLKNEKFFVLNRIFLLSALILPFILPVLPAMTDNYIRELQTNVTAINPFTAIYSNLASPGTTTLADFDRSTSASILLSVFNWSLTDIILGCYSLVTLVLLSRFFVQLSKLILFINKSKKRISDNVCICEHEKKIAPFSFLHYLVINTSPYSTEDLKEIIAHEKVHIHQSHTFDLLLVETLQTFFWINPFMRTIKKYIKLNLEYTADQQVLNSGTDKINYQLSIVNSSQRLSSYPLTNLFHSSKLKLRIEMMNSNKSPLRNLYRFGLVLPLLLSAYFLVNPVFAGLNEKITFENYVIELKEFEGYYQFEKDKDAYIQILTSGNHLILKQLWNKEEFSFEQKSALEFYNKEHQFPLKFSRGADGQISQVLAFSKDVWNKIKNYKPVIQKEVQLTTVQLKAFEGSYKLKGKEEAYLQFTTKGNHIIVKESWSGKEIEIAPKSSLEFFGTDMRYPVKFTMGQGGTAKEVLIFDRDVWEKVKEIKPKKEISFSAD